MILEELLEKFAIRLLALEKLLTDREVLQEDEILRAEEEINRELSEDTGERIRQLNSPGKLQELRDRGGKKP